MNPHSASKSPVCTLFVSAAMMFSFTLIGCAGGGLSTPINGGPPPTSITSVTVTCNAATVPVNQQNQCTSSVQGTGNFNSVVNWAVNGTQGGNATVGTINAMGLYTAPAAVPTPFTVTITATSAANSSVSGSAGVIVSGTIATATQTISAASGGTITLPDGSSVTIAGGVLPADDTVTLSEVSVLPNQPPNPALTSVGAGLILSFSNPVRISSTVTSGTRRPAMAHPAGQSTGSPAIEFSLSTSSYNQNLLQSVGSSVPFADFTSSSGTENFLGLLGGFVSASNAFIGSTESQIIAGLSVTGSAIQSIAFSAANLAKDIVRLVQTPTRLRFDASTSLWQQDTNWSTSDCPTGTTLVLVHGMASTVEDTFPPSVVGEIEKASSAYYKSVVGFDYNWLQPINQSGSQLASFLNDLRTECGEITSLDIEAHSEGVPVSMSAVTQSLAQVDHLISLGGPIMGTPMAGDRGALQTVILNLGGGLSLPLGTPNLQEVFKAPFLSDLTPNSVTLSAIRTSLATKQNAPELIVTGGDNPLVKLNGTPLYVLSPVMGANFDGVVQWTSALGFGSGLRVHPLVDPLQLFVALGHNDLVSNFNLQTLIADQISKPSVQSPSLSCTSSASNCEGPRGATFTFDGQGFSPEPTAVQIFEQDSSGNVSPLPTSLQDNGGNITWSVTPTCSDATGSFSIIPFDMGEMLASNDVVQKIDAGSCSGTNPNPAPSISSLSPTALPVSSAPQALTINGSGFIAGSFVTFNGVSHVPTIVSSTELTIPLSSTDLAAAGNYPVIVTNPAPGGGTSNVVDFTVSSAASGTVVISPASITVPEGGAQSFSASVVGSSSGVTWSVQEGPTGGSLTNPDSASVIYVPPSSSGTFHLVATSVDNTSQRSTAVVTVVSAATFVVLHSFTGGGADGTQPHDGLLQASDGNFYGTTEQGGSGSIGTIFEMNRTGGFSLLHSFGQSDGRIPSAALIQGADGALYGTTQGGGTAGFGTVFKTDFAGNLSVLHSFADNGSDGNDPTEALLQAKDGGFYGTTLLGGAQNSGTVFKLSASGEITTIHLFTGSDGAGPSALIQAADGSIYGTTKGGGPAACGTIFEIDATGSITTLHSFNGTDGCNPVAALVQGLDGALYGTTVEGGTNNMGTAFRMDNKGTLTVLHSFSGIDGSQPSAELIQATDGYFYGTTQSGGTTGFGTLFRMDDLGNITVLHSFAGAEGANPVSALLQGSDGNLYGTTFSGGSNFIGVIFRMSLQPVSTGSAGVRVMAPRVRNRE